MRNSSLKHEIPGELLIVFLLESIALGSTACLIELEWLRPQITLTALPSGQLVFRVALEWRHSAFKGYFLWRICPFWGTVAGNCVVPLRHVFQAILMLPGAFFGLQKSSELTLCFGVSWSGEEQPFQGWKRLALRFWRRCKQVVGLNCGFSNGSKFPLERLSSPPCRRKIQRSATAF